MRKSEPRASGPLHNILIDDSLALKKADDSISLRGAWAIATDTAHTVFLKPDKPPD
jgi:hypothetical protein